MLLSSIVDIKFMGNNRLIVLSKEKNKLILYKINIDNEDI